MCLFIWGSWLWLLALASLLRCGCLNTCGVKYTQCAVEEGQEAEALRSLWPVFLNKMSFQS